MSVRVVTVAATLLAAGPAFAETLGAEAARRVVVGKTFVYNCFDGTRGAGRIQSDLSVAGTIQVRGSGPVRFVQLPPGTLRVKGDAVCAAVRGIPFEPCFNVERTDPQSFRGSIAGLSFAYCDFTRRIQRTPSVRTTAAPRQPAQPLAIQAAALPAGQ
ncbi:MAG: hypothetical protein IT536_06755 [Hyphomicrobiales bacterium]|nr:hypothetical protein [Hyphomicrobiales bacterium]